MKWSEEEFVVIQILGSVFGHASIIEEVFELAILGLKNCPECHEKDGIGLIGVKNPLLSNVMN